MNFRVDRKRVMKMKSNKKNVGHFLQYVTTEKLKYLLPKNKEK